MALGDLEREVMTVLWERYDPLTVREVHQELARERHRDLAYTTVMTVLDRLAKKGVVRQLKEGRAYRYAPAQSREEMTASVMMDALSGTPDQDAALAHFVGQLPPEALRAAIEAAARQDR
ncbi:BlaI/MecI/CopY family transcriptional regulator [Paractinoplanes globisporus]|uniref:BlaI/MecI/CopY family transcriptional regulator n=1 Tax=Paractinoplanes globisporus TaxID=113565 RepID=A0ABW6WCL7_9ACTN|nr:BlaI/MecI/CopY family transcriptional regulator [Actinoplanes globisporus]